MPEIETFARRGIKTRKARTVKFHKKKPGITCGNPFVHVLLVDDDLLDLLDARLQVDLLHGDAVRLLHLGDVTHPGLQDADSGLEVGLRLGQLTGIGLGQAEICEMEATDLGGDSQEDEEYSQED